MTAILCFFQPNNEVYRKPELFSDVYLKNSSKSPWGIYFQKQREEQERLAATDHTKNRALSNNTNRQGWSSDTKDFSSNSIDSDTFPCTISSSNNESPEISLLDMTTGGQQAENKKASPLPGDGRSSVALQVKPKDQNGALLGSSSSFANRG